MDKFSAYEPILVAPEHYSRHFTRKFGELNLTGVRCSHCEKTTTEHYVTTPPYTSTLCMDCFWHAKSLYEWASKSKVGRNVGTMITKFSGLASTRTTTTHSAAFAAAAANQSINSLSSNSTSQRTSAATTTTSNVSYNNFNALAPKKRPHDEDAENTDDTEEDKVSKALEKKPKPTTHEDAVKTINSYVDTVTKQIDVLKGSSVKPSMPTYKEQNPASTFVDHAAISNHFSSMREVMRREILGEAKTINISFSTGRKLAVREGGSAWKTVGDLMQRIEQMEGLSVDHQRIIFQGKYAEKTKTLEECGIKDGATVGLVLNTSAH